MKTKQILQENTLARFQEIYDALYADRRWWRDASPLRYASISALTCPGPANEVAASIRKITDNLKTEAGFFGQLNRSLRFIIAAILLGHDDTARGFLREVKRVRALFRQEGIRRAAIYETMAVLILRLQAQQKPIESKSVKRLKSLYEEMKRHHWWLTGPEDLPTCAVLCSQGDSVEQIAQKSKNIYKSLAKQKNRKGNALQTAANILCMVPMDAAKIAKRYSDLSTCFRESGVTIWQSDYDDLAILTFLNHPTKRVVNHVLEHRQTMKTLKPRPDRKLSFSMATGTTFVALAKTDKTLKTVTAIKALMDMQAIIQAQRAAAATAAAC